MFGEVHFDSVDLNEPVIDIPGLGETRPNRNKYLAHCLQCIALAVQTSNRNDVLYRRKWRNVNRRNPAPG